MEMKTNERMAAIREEVIANLALDVETKVATGEFIVETANGFARVTVTAIKDFDFDVAGAHAAYVADLAAKAEAKAIKDAEKAEKLAAKEAAKAAKEAAKE